MSREVPKSDNIARGLRKSDKVDEAEDDVHQLPLIPSQQHVARLQVEM
jgi:hypothetical protein